MLYRALIAATLLFSAGFFAPQPVLGSCGDWLAHSSPPADEQVDSINQLAGQEPPPSPKRRCSGPGCQQSPMAPIPAPSAPSTDWRRVDLVCWFDVSCVVSSSYVRCHKEDFLDLAVGYDLGIERPPRV